MNNGSHDPIKTRDESLIDRERTPVRPREAGHGATNAIRSDCEPISQEMLFLANLDQPQIDALVRAVPGGVKNIQDVYPLSPLQEGMLFHHLLDQDRDTYVLSTLFELRSSVHREALIDALQKVIDRHDVLRTALMWEDVPKPVQIVHRHAKLPVETCMLDTGVDPLEQLKERMRPGRQAIDLRRAPLARLVIATDPRREIEYAVLHVHHVVCDHQSLRNLVDEALIYTAGRERELPAPAQFKNYVAQIPTNAREEEAFFRSKLGEVDEPTAPFGLLGVHGSVGDMGEDVYKLNPDLAGKVRLQARRYGVSSARLFHAAWALLLAHTCARDDVVFGTVVLAGTQRGTRSQRMLGMSVNTLPLRLRLRALTAQQLVEQTHQELLELLNYEATPLTVSQRCSAIADTAPLFTSLLNYRHSSFPAADEPTADIRVLARRDAWTNYPVTMTVDDQGTGFVLTAQTDLRIDPQRIVTYLRTAIESLVDALERAPQTQALTLPIVPESERRLVIEQFNATHAAYSHEKLVHQLVEEQAQRTPAALAMTYEGESLTYAELNDRANQLARYLRSEGIVTDQLVGACFERGLEMVVGLLGILKAGAAYVPLDPNYPVERLRYMLEDAQPRVVLTQEKLKSVIPAIGVKIVVLDLQHRGLTSHSPENLPAAELELTSRSLVYVIYTSGSTGYPKGTMMSHRSMVNLIQWHGRELPLRGGERVLQFAALSFDVAFQEIFSTLGAGGTLVLLNEWIRRDARALMEFLNEQAIERLFVPPLILQSLAEHFKTARISAPKGLKDVITAGEQLRISAEVVNFIKHLAACRLHNHYGPTETHVVTALTLTGDPGEWPEFPKIGRPISNTQMYVLDEQLQPAPIGVVGEIYIGGTGVARGYQNRPELTEQRFVTDPFSTDAQARLYKTGDLGRWSADGLLDYLGRNDDQVKIRGFRIELGEIESQLAQHEAVKEAALIAREDMRGEKRLVAYVTSRNQVAPSAEALRTHLEAILPDHMVPTAFVTLDHLPVTPNGKLDRRSLPAPDVGAYVSRQYEAPQGEVETALAAIWQSLLGIDRVGRNDNFFQLGGNSVSAMRLAVRVADTFAARINVQAIFRTPVMRQMAESVEHLQRVIQQNQDSHQDSDQDQVDEIVI